MDPPTSTSSHSIAEGNKFESGGSMTNRYFNHLFDSIKRDSDEIYMLCQQTSDLGHAKRLRRLFQSYVRDLTSLVQYLSINEESAVKDYISKDVSDCGEVDKNYRSKEAKRYFLASHHKSADVRSENHETLHKDSQKRSSSARNHSESFSTVGHNVDAPCFVPLRPNFDEESASNLQHQDFDPSHAQWLELLNEGVPHFNQNFWHLPALLHSQYPLPHYHMACASNLVPYAGTSGISNYSSMLFPSLQSHGLSIPVQYPPYPHYAGLMPPPHYSTSDSDNSDHMEGGKRPKTCFHGIRPKVFLQSDRGKLMVVAPSESKSDTMHNLHGFNQFKKDSGNNQDSRVPENKPDRTSTINLENNSVVIPSNKLSSEDIRFENTEIETTQNIPKEPPKIICIVNTERTSTDVSNAIEEGFLAQERLGDFPELIPHGVGSKTKIARKMKYRLPRVKYQKKPKFSLSDLYKTFGSPSLDRSTTPRTNKNLLSNSTSNPSDKDQKSKASMYHKPKCCCSNQRTVYPRYRNVCEKGPEDISDEADGWKKVKPRFRNRDHLKHVGIKEDFGGVNSCKVCQSNYQRLFEPSLRNKSINVGRKQQFRNEHCEIHINNCVRGPISSQVLDLHYKNMFVPTQVMQKQRKLNNTTVMRPATINFRVHHNDPAMMPTKSPFSEEQIDVSAHHPTNSLTRPHVTDTIVIGNVRTNSLDPDYRIGDLLEVNPYSLSPFMDDDVGSTNTLSTLPTAVSPSLSCLVLGTEDDKFDDEETSAAKNVSDETLADTSFEEDSQTADIPVVEDAQDMHDDFMKYLNSSTWPTQMDEIDKFESMVAGNNPSDPVLMYPSVSVEQFEEFIHRHPDEAQAFRREISSKLEKINETETKQQQAYEKRLQLLECKTAKVRGFVQKVKDVQLAQDKLALKRKHQIDEKLRKAEENRKNYLSIIRRKAHDEEEKLKEIAFINELEAQNRRHDSLALRQEHEERLQCIIDERQRKVEEKAAKEAAVEERRRVLEAERQQKLLKIAEARRKKEETIDRKQQERENQRLVIAREKAREREERLLALNAAQRATAEELQKRIQQKQEDSARRHEENIESIRQRALDIGLHRNPDDTDELVNMDPELSTNGSKEKLKALRKKRCRKLRSRMTVRATDFMKDYSDVSAENLPFAKVLDAIQPEAGRVHIKELLQHVTFLKGILVEGDVKSKLKTTRMFDDFSKSKGFVVLVNVLKDYINKPHHALDSQHLQLFTAVINIFQASVQNGDNWKYFVLSNDIMFIMDCLRFSVMGLKLREPSWSKISEKLVELLTLALDHMSAMTASKDEEFSSLNSRMADVVSYIINSGLVEKIIAMFQDAVMDDDYHNMNMIPSCIKFFTSLISKRYKCDELMNTLVSTDCFGTIPLLYEGLQKMAGLDELPVYIVPVIDLLLKFAELDVVLFQNTLGDDGMALQVRAIASNLMNYCKGKPLDELLQCVILLVGFFAIKNVKNQTLLQSGQQPTVLQQLVTLPFIYFCDSAYTDYLFPTLFVCSYSNPTNKAIVANELSFCHLEDYIKSERGKKNKMVQLFYSMKENS